MVRANKILYNVIIKNYFFRSHWAFLNQNLTNSLSVGLFCSSTFHREHTYYGHYFKVIARIKGVNINVKHFFETGIN